MMMSGCIVKICHTISLTSIGNQIRASNMRVTLYQGRLIQL